MKVQLFWWVLRSQIHWILSFPVLKYAKGRSCLSGQEAGIPCAEGNTQTTEMHFHFLSLRESLAGYWKPASTAKRRENALRYRENNRAQMGDVERGNAQLCPNGHPWSPGGWHLHRLHPVSWAGFYSPQARALQKDMHPLRKSLLRIHHILGLLFWAAPSFTLKRGRWYCQ